MKKLLLFLFSLTGWMGVTAQGLSQGVYFWGSDPGFGNGQALLAEDGNFGDAIETILANEVPVNQEGPQQFNVRVQDENGAWGPLFTFVVQGDAAFSTIPDIEVAQGEYFWGADPGFGNGQALFAEDGNFGDAIETLLAMEVPMNEEGPQLFNLRVLDANGVWGPTFTVLIHGDAAFSTVPEIEVTQAEYFWGSDPGQGNGSPMFALDGNLDEAIETVVNTAIDVAEEPSVEVLSIRVRDAENVWGPVFSVVVSIEPAISSSREIKVSAAEYYFNDDPGPGNGTAMLATNGNFNNAIEALKGGDIPGPIEAGIHVLWMRARDAENQWGPPFGVVVNMDTTITGLNAQINGQSIFCQGDNLTGIPYSTPATGGSTYVWTATNGAVVSGQGTPNVNVNWNPSGNRTLNLTQCLGGDCQSSSLTLTVNQIYTVENAETICQGQSIFLGGANQSTAGVYTDVFQTIEGCDSTVVTTLSVVESIQVEQAFTLCNGESLFVGGAQQSNSGVYVDTFESSLGCDSVVTTNLTVLDPIQVNEEAEVCEGGSIFLAGDFQSSPGLYTEVFTSVEGCDSVVVTNLSIIPAPILEETVAICPGQSYFVGGAEQTEPGQYFDTTVDQDGCQTITVTTLVVESGFEVNESATICQGQSIFLGGAEQTEPGEYIDITTDGEGCEISVITTLTVTPPEVVNESAEICQGQSIFLGGAEQSEAGVYTDIVSDVNGCDAVIVTTLSIIPPQVVNESAEICEGQTIFLGGAEQSEAGVYTDAVTDENGCELIVQTTLSIVDQLQVQVNESICAGDSLFVGGAWQVNPGAYTDVFETAAGCDSLVVTTISLINPTQSTDEAEICQGDSLFVGGAFQTTTGFYTDVFTASNGCDSTVVTLLTVTPAPQPEVSFTGGLLTTTQAETYQWFFNGEAIEGANNQFLLPEEEGAYSVLVSYDDGCSATSDPFVFIPDGVADHLLKAVKLFPNPGDGQFTISGLPLNTDRVEVYDLTGRMLHSARPTASLWQLDLQGQASGTYLTVLFVGDQVLTLPVVIAR